MTRTQNQGKTLEKKKLENRYIDGFYWYRNKEEKKVIYLHCSEKYLEQCPATASIKMEKDGEDEIQTFHTKYTVKDHTHDIDESLPKDNDFIVELCKATTASFQPLRKIYEELKQKYPEAARDNPYSLQRMNMDRWRKKSLPPTPNTYGDMLKTLGDDRWKKILYHTHGYSIVKGITCEEEITGLLIGYNSFPRISDEKLTLSLFISSALKPQIDNTKYVLSLSVNHEGFAFDFAWALLKDLSPHVLEAAVLGIKRNFGKHYIDKKIVTNCDWRIMSAMKKRWPESEVVPSFHSYCLAILKEAKKTEAIEFQRHLPILKKLMALALLPGRMISPTFNWLVRTLNDADYKTFEPLLQWYLLTIIKAITPEKISFYKKDNQLLNTGLHAPKSLLSHARVAGRTGARLRKLPAWSFLQKTLRITDASCSDLERLKEKKKANISRTPKVTCFMSKSILHSAWKKLEAEPDSSKQFLNVVAFHGQRFVKNLIHCELQVEEVMEPASTLGVETTSLGSMKTLPNSHADNIYEEMNIDQWELKKKPKRGTNNKEISAEARQDLECNEEETNSEASMASSSASDSDDIDDDSGINESDGKEPAPPTKNRKRPASPLNKEGTLASPEKKQRLQQTGNTGEK